MVELKGFSSLAKQTVERRQNNIKICKNAENLKVESKFVALGEELSGLKQNTFAMITSIINWMERSAAIKLKFRN